MTPFKGQQNKGQQSKGQQNKGQQNKGQQNKDQQNASHHRSCPLGWQILHWGTRLGLGISLSLGLSMCTFRSASDTAGDTASDQGGDTASSVQPIAKPIALSAAEAEAFANRCAAITDPLTPEEEADARVAWQYFLNNRQAKTGFTNAADSYPSGTLWDMGNYLTALNAARWLDLIDQPEFDHQLNQFLTSLGEIPLVADALPNKVYNVSTTDMVDYRNQPSKQGLGWSALDIGRMLTALDIVQRCHPQYRPWIEGIVARWQLGRSVLDGELYGGVIKANGKIDQLQEGRLGYGEYAARGYTLWGYDVPEALALEPAETVKVEGVEIEVDPRDFESSNANNYVVSESYILEAIEFGWSKPIAHQAQQVFEAQKQRYERTGNLTAVSEDNIDQAPHFLYSTVYANGDSWAVITEDNEPHPELRTLSTKAAFGWSYLFPEDEYAQQLREEVRSLQAPDGGGYYAGRYEASGEINEILTGNTNGLMLEILYHKARGNQPLLADAFTQQTALNIDAN